METQIKIDLELHKLIEAKRTSLAQTQRDIIVAALSGSRPADEDQTAIVPSMTRASRSRGKYGFDLFGKSYTEGSLKSVLKTVYLEIEDRQPGFIDKLSHYRTERGRRLTARTPHEVYPGRPQLVEQGCAEKLANGWWFDTNVSAVATKRYLAIACETAGIKLGKDLKVEF